MGEMIDTGNVSELLSKMKDYIKQLEQQNEWFQMKLAGSEYEKERLKRKGHILYTLKGRMSVKPPVFSLDCVIMESYTLKSIKHRLYSAVSLATSDTYARVCVKATYNYKDHIDYGDNWYRQLVWTIDACFDTARRQYLIESWYFYGLPKNSLKNIHGVNLIDYINRHV
jgi:hypothetical protein